MNVKGFIIEDNHGREFVLVCEPPYRQLGPLQYTEPELREIAGGVLATLHDLFRSLPELLEHSHGVSSGKGTAHGLQQSGKW
jgi:hypothetical protein